MNGGLTPGQSPLTMHLVKGLTVIHTSIYSHTVIATSKIRLGHTTILKQCMNYDCNTLVGDAGVICV